MIHKVLTVGQQDSASAPTFPNLAPVPTRGVSDTRYLVEPILCSQLGHGAGNWPGLLASNCRCEYVCYKRS